MIGVLSSCASPQGGSLARISLSGWQALSAQAQSVEADSYGDKVLLCEDGSYLKIFRRKRVFSSQFWSPPALRFASNCRMLEACGVPCPSVIQVYRIPARACDAVHYRPLSGKTLLQLFRQGIQGEEASRLRRQMGTFVACLHSLGIYFRSLHFGNIVLTPSGALGLIDVADICFYRRALGRFRRERNLKHLRRYSEEAQWLWQTEDFQEAYAALRPTPTT